MDGDNGEVIQLQIFLRSLFNFRFWHFKRLSPPNCFFTRLAGMFFISSAIDMTRHIFNRNASNWVSRNRKIYSFEIARNPFFCKSHFCIINNRVEISMGKFNFISEFQLLRHVEKKCCCFLLIGELKRHDWMKISVVGNWIVKWWFFKLRNSIQTTEAGGFCW